MKDSAAVKEFKKDIAVLDKKFDEIFAALKTSRLTRAEYSAVESALYSKVEDFKYVMETEQ